MVAPTSFAVGEKSRLPMVHCLGVVPAQWTTGSTEGTDLSQAQSYVQTAFSLAVRNSRRFQVLNDDLVEGLWNSQSGRAELVGEYELDVFANLGANVLADNVVLVARILDKNLKGLLQESTTVNRDWLAQASYDDIQGTMTDLVFKLTNRLPIDVTVTSVQGKFITISGGIAKGINKGDTLQLVRPYVASLHPANNNWLTFETEPLGSAEIVEAKEMTAVARLTMLKREGAVEIGDGARIKTIAGRTRFVAKSPAETPVAVTETIIVPPLYASDAKPIKGDSTPGAVEAGSPSQASINGTPGAILPKRETAESRAYPGPPTTNVPAPSGAAPSAGVAADEGSSDYLSQFYSPFAFDGVGNVVAKVADRVSFQVGQTKWWYVGPGSTGSQMVWYLPVNTVGARITREIIPQIKYGIGGGVGVGKTANLGSYFSYDSHIRLYWETDLVLAGGAIQKAQAGVQGNFSGLSVNGARYGGGDWIQGGIFGGLMGQLSIPQTVDWYGEFAIIPLTLGRVGYDGTHKSVRASFGWRLGLGGYLASVPQAIEWGAGLDYSGMNLHDSKGKETGLSTISVMGLARYRF